MDPAELVRTVLGQLAAPKYGGAGGTCYECPFASVPLSSDGRVELWESISHDPTEAYFRCSLPGRDHAAVVWGEYAPCTEREWAAAGLAALPGDDGGLLAYVKSNTAKPRPGSRTLVVLAGEWAEPELLEAGPDEAVCGATVGRDGSLACLLVPHGVEVRHRNGVVRWNYDGREV